MWTAQVDALHNLVGYVINICECIKQLILQLRQMTHTHTCTHSIFRFKITPKSSLHNIDSDVNLCKWMLGVFCESKTSEENMRKEIRTKWENSLVWNNFLLKWQKKTQLQPYIFFVIENQLHCCCPTNPFCFVSFKAVLIVYRLSILWLTAADSTKNYIVLIHIYMFIFVWAEHILPT